MWHNKLRMSTTPNKLTETFNSQVKSLIEKGIVANYAEVVRTLDWNPSMMTEVTKGRKNVPLAVYRKFTKQYSLIPANVVNEDEPQYGDKDEIIALLRQNNKLLEEQLNLATGELRHIAVMNYSMIKSMRGPLAKLLAKAEREELLQVAGKLDKETNAIYRSVRERGSLIDLGI